MKPKKIEKYNDFNQFELSSDILKALSELGYQTPTPIQAQTIALLMANQDVIGCAQTGTGKTAAFSLPVLQRLDPNNKTVQALIITPTRELAEQVYQSIQDYSRYLPIRSTVLYGGVPNRPQEYQLSQNPHIVVATPGRLMDHLERKTIRLTFVRYLILDEADRMLDMGFIPDIETILTYIPRERQTLLFSATMPPAIEKLAQRITQNPQLVEVGQRSSASTNITQQVYYVSGARKLRLLEHLIRTHPIESAIVFCKTKLGVDRLTRELQRLNVEVVCLHSDIDQTIRQRNLNAFKSKNIRILVATDVAARGIDIEHVSHVINYDTPIHAEDYVHRIGRTGRASATGEAITFTSPEEKKYLKAIEALLGKPVPVVEQGDTNRPKTLEKSKVPTPTRSSERARTDKAKGSQTERVKRQTKPEPVPQQVSTTAATSPSISTDNKRKQVVRKERPAQPAPWRHYMQDLEDVEYLDI